MRGLQYGNTSVSGIFEIGDGTNWVGIRYPNQLSTNFDIILPPNLPASTKALIITATGQIDYVEIGGGGTVTSVGLTAPTSLFDIDGSPVTASGNLSLTLKSQVARTFFAAPSNENGTPEFRAIAWSDVSELGGNSGNSFALGNDARFHVQNTDTSTTSATFQIDSANDGNLIKNNADELQVRNNTDTEYRDLRVRNLTVEGTQTVVNTTVVSYDDAILRVNGDFPEGVPTEDLGIEGLRGDEPTAQAIWSESQKRWLVGTVGNLFPVERCRTFDFTSADLVGDILTINHQLKAKVVSIEVLKSDGNYLGRPSRISRIDDDNISVSFAGINISGTATILIRG